MTISDSKAAPRIPFRPELLDLLREHYALPWEGIHGFGHWMRVLKIGTALAELTGANPRVVAAFAMIHDVGRRNEGRDPDHGRRSALLARDWNQDYLSLSADEFLLFEKACTDHTRGLRSEDATIGTCWDADRLDLGRVWKVVDPRLLSTTHAREPRFLAWAGGLWTGERI